MYVYIKPFQLCGRLAADFILFVFLLSFLPPVRLMQRIINECGQACAWWVEFCIIRFIFTWAIHFSCSVSLIVMPHLWGVGWGSFLCLEHTCSDQTVLISAGGTLFPFGLQSDQKKGVWHCHVCTAIRKGPSEAAIYALWSLNRSKVD